MGVLGRVAIDEIVKRGSVKPVDVVGLRRTVADAGGLGPRDADILVTINKACPVQDPAWTEFYVATLADFLVNQSAPEGYITADKAVWLVARIARDGRVETRADLDLLLTTLRLARWCPLGLVRFALEQVHFAILTGEGPLRGGQKVEHGACHPEDVALVRRILASFGADATPVTRAELGALLAIEDSVTHGAGVDEWRTLFMQAAAQAILAGCGFAVPDRTAIFAAQAPVDFKWIGARLLSSEESEIARLEMQRLEIITQEPVADLDIGELAARLSRPEGRTRNEAALVSLLGGSPDTLPPAMMDVLNRSARAA